MFISKLFYDKGQPANAHKQDMNLKIFSVKDKIYEKRIFDETFDVKSFQDWDCIPFNSYNVKWYTITCITYNW